MAEGNFLWGSGGEKQDPNERRRRIAEAMMKSGMDATPIQSWTQGAARVAQALIGGWQAGDLDTKEKSGQAEADRQFAQLTGAGAQPAAPSMAGGASRTMAMPGVTPEMKTGIADAAGALGISPVDLATTISYETGGTFDPTKAGPTTKWGQHRGLIQFGEPQAKQYGVDWSNPVGSQLGANGAVVAYLRDRGVKPGMGLMDIYSTINAGAPGLYDRSDAGAGGAPGTVADKVNNQMAGHRAKAMALFGNAGGPDVAMTLPDRGGLTGPAASYAQNLPGRSGGAMPDDLLQPAADRPAPGASFVSEETGTPGFFIPPGPQPENGFLGERGALPNFDPETGRWQGPSNPPALAAAPQPAPDPMPDGPAPAMTGATMNDVLAVNRPLDPMFQSEGASQPWMGSAIMPAPPQPQVAQAAPMPPPRPSDLAMPQVDLPAPGARQAMAQVPVAPAPSAAGYPAIDPNSNDAGALSGLVASEEARRGQPSGASIMLPGGSAAPSGSSPSIFDRIAAAVGGGNSQPAPTAAPSPGVQRVAAASDATAQPAAAAPSAGVERVASAMPGQNSQTAAAMAVLNNPYARPAQRAIAQSIVERSLAPKNVQTVDLGNSIGVLDAQGNVTRQIPKTAAPSKPSYGKIGVDGNGDEVFGFIDPEKQIVTPSAAGKVPQGGQPAATAGSNGQAPAGAGQPAIPPAPPGVNGKIWREEQSKRAVENNLPASFEDTTKARNEIVQLPAYKNMAQAAPIYRGMAEAAGRNTKAADLNLVYGLGKIMDPGSVVREGEIQMANDAQGWSQKLNGMIAQINGGGGLTPEGRKSLMAEAYGRLKSYEGLYNQDADFYRGLAKNRRMNPDEIVRSFGTFEPWEPAPPPGAAKPGAPGAPAAAPSAPKSKADFDALPSGSRFLDPNGQVRVKP